jgi:hypothetical protein
VLSVEECLQRVGKMRRDADGIVRSLSELLSSVEDHRDRAALHRIMVVLRDMVHVLASSAEHAPPNIRAAMAEAMLSETESCARCWPRVSA